MLQSSKGIPQGGCASSAIANFYLHEHENVFLSKSQLTMFRYIDDLLIFYYEDYNINFHEYPNYLNLIKTSSHKDEANFLDLHLKLETNQVITDIYQKNNEFHLNINNLQHFSSNLHISLFRNIVINQLHRIVNICNKQENVSKQINIFKARAYSKGYPPNFYNSIIHNFNFNQFSVQSRF